eukprot:GILJ01015013.1.p2 GENE.GILJ01015013.1~~GILJ01015013.1.p2  ORF type:complete len:127 (-),score=3.53 GILJ01015013.1:233-613(-)
MIGSPNGIDCEHRHGDEFLETAITSTMDLAAPIESRHQHRPDIQPMAVIGGCTTEFESDVPESLSSDGNINTISVNATRSTVLPPEPAATNGARRIKGVRHTPYVRGVSHVVTRSRSGTKMLSLLR